LLTQLRLLIMADDSKLQNAWECEQSKDIVKTPEIEDIVLPNGQHLEQEISVGTRQWSSISANVYFGCVHDCLYCYAKQMATRFKREKGAWNKPIPNIPALKKNWRVRKGIIMFPTSHDISPDPEIMKNCFTTLEKLLKPGNHVLLVSKMHKEVAQELLNLYGKGITNEKDVVKTALRDKNRSLLNIRVTIGSCLQEDLDYWEPGAPTYNDRLECLKMLYHSGFNTSVSIEPMLNTNVLDKLISEIRPFVTDSIWVGTMSYLWRVEKMNPNVIGIKEKCEKIKAKQNAECLEKIFKKYKNDKLIMWKHHILVLAKQNKW
jgi:DNA repair photolyase